VDGDGLVFGFFSGVSDFFDDVAGLPFAFASDLLDVFGVNTNSVHTVLFLNGWITFW
jgi:hypothetical protein